jgi:phage shock protein PspC (stress-responsive transcriptional regulator)
MFAGVSGALARATNTDPVLWRVVLVVLTLFGGTGLLAYLIGWLLLPADGDTATPVEALGGHGWSRTSRGWTIVGIVVVALQLAGSISAPWRATPLIAVLVIGGVLLLLLRDQSHRRSGGAGTTAPPSPGPVGAPAPFAPHGPFVSPAQQPVPVWSAPPPRPRRPRSRLGLFTLSLAALVLGALVALDVLGYSVPPLAYFAAPLAVFGLGLLVGTWFGRAYWLIPFGLALCLAIGGGYTATHIGHWQRWQAGNVEWTPATVADVQEHYVHNVGNTQLDLSKVDFTGRDVYVTVELGAGTLQVTLPPDVDATVVATVDVGNADVLNQHWDGIGEDTRTVTDLGPDGPGGGQLHLTATVHTGTLEVHR